MQRHTSDGEIDETSMAQAVPFESRIAPPDKRFFFLSRMAHHSLMTHARHPFSFLGLQPQDDIVEPGPKLAKTEVSQRECTERLTGGGRVGLSGGMPRLRRRAQAAEQEPGTCGRAQSYRHACGRRLGSSMENRALQELIIWPRLQLFREWVDGYLGRTFGRRMFGLVFRRSSGLVVVGEKHVWVELSS